MSSVRKLKLFFTLAWQSSPSYVFSLVLDTLFSTGRVLVNVVLPKYLVDELTGSRDPSTLILWGAALVGSNLFFAFILNTMKRVMDVRNVYVQEKMSQAMAEKIMHVEFAHLENPYYLDLKERAVFVINRGSIQTLITGIASVLKSVFTIAGLLAVMLTLSWGLVVLLVGAIACSLILHRSFANYQATFHQELIPVNRKYGYYFSLCYNDRLQKDIRLYSMSRMMVDRVGEYNGYINRWYCTFMDRRGKTMGLHGVISDLQATLAYGYTGVRVITDAFGPRIGLGSFTMYVAAATSFTASVSEIGTSFISLEQQLKYLDPFMEFMLLPNESELGGERFDGTIDSIEFQGVSFKYPGSQTMVLEDISFAVGRGEKISIVGLNGAGKSTLVKLLCRFYRPTAGKILVNGRDIFEYDYASYMKQIAAVFQDYKLFAFSIAENITCSDINSDMEQTLRAVEQVGLSEKVKGLPKGIHSLFGKAYDTEGIEMSGGESQKVAIARALYKGASLIVLDEPTSALDPLAEAEIYQHFNSLVGEKTALYISHRMSSSVFCDRILVIEGGRVCDFDTHESLMKKKDSLYFKLFSSQAENYRIDA